MTSEEAVEQAQALATERGWPWRSPVAVKGTRRFVLLGRRQIEVRSNASMLGTNVVVLFDAETGRIERAAFLPR